MPPLQLANSTVCADRASGPDAFVAVGYTRAVAVGRNVKPRAGSNPATPTNWIKLAVRERTPTEQYLLCESSGAAEPRWGPPRWGRGCPILVPNWHLPCQSGRSRVDQVLA